MQCGLGQGIPAGLHIRINLETGKKEAKILDDNEQEDEKKSTLQADDRSKNAALSVVQEEETLAEKNADEKPKKIKHLEEALQRIGIDYTPKEKVEKVLRSFRNYEDLKKDFGSMRKGFKTDAQIIIQLIEEFRNTSTATDIKDVNDRIKTQTQILESFSYLMSQFDNALLFVEQNGLEHVLLPILVNQTHTGLKVEALRVLGAMSQNHPQVQIKVHERNVDSLLAQIIMTSTKTEELSAALYAFSSLLRKFPFAQQRILSTSGTQALVSVLSRDCELKVKAKAATVIGDLIEERELALSKKLGSDDPSVAKQYAEINFKVWLVDHEYCEIMPTLINTHAPAFLKAPDILEYFVNAVHNSHTLCGAVWKENPFLRDIFTYLQQHYSQSQDEYHQDVAKLLSEFLSLLDGEENMKHDEL